MMEMAQTKSFKEKVSAFYDIETNNGKKLRLIIQSLIVISILAFSFETIPNLPNWAITILTSIEYFTIFVFTIEYIFHIYITDTKLKFIFSFYGIVDLLAILPFYLALLITSGVDLRFIRMLRLIRLFKIFEHNKSIKKFSNAIKKIKNDLILFGVITISILFFSAILVYLCENEAQPEAFASVFHGLWWSIVTLTTVGYGDVYPVTLGGRMITFVLLLVGLAIVSIPAGLLASALSENSNN